MTPVQTGGKNLLVNATAAAQGFAGIEFSAVANSAQNFSAVTSATTDNVYFIISETAWKSVPIETYTGTLTYSVAIN